MPELLEIRDACFVRAGAQPVAVPALTLRGGDVAVVHGPSGAGKTTLLEGLLGVPRRGPGRVSVSGDVRLCGRDWPPRRAAELRRALRDDVAWLPQDPLAAFDPLRRLGEQLAAATPHASAADRDAVLRRVDLGDEPLLARAPHAASGGQLQRLLVAIAMLRRPRLVLADEPTAGLDRPRAEAVLRALGELAAAPAPAPALLVATHDAPVAARLGGRPFALRDGQLAPAEPVAPRWPARLEAPPADAAVRLRCSRPFDVRVPQRRTAIVTGVDVALHDGEVVALLGPSGVGKTRLLRCLAGHDRTAPRGAVRGPRPRRATQLVFQDAAGSLTSHLRAGELLAHAAGRSASPADIAAEALALGLAPELLERPCGALSGGERRRVALLRALLARPAVLLLDEPTADLDPDRAVAVAQRVLEDVAARGTAVLWATHDEALAFAVADRVLRLGPGRGLWEEWR
ncbi:MAG: ATP-binding cassette domain-containing protein [Planctomycetes bacterium]|nr:ATP-binding cassette domain-containing protein [Planctomycetota bacterium]